MAFTDISWLEIKVKVPPEHVDAVANLFHEEGSGVALEEPASRSFVVISGYLPVTESVQERLEKLRAAITKVLDNEGPVITVSELAVEDWAESWRRYYRPFRVGRRLVIKQSWNDYDARDDDLVMVVDPGLAFGCGCHPTTCLCLELLERYLFPGAAVCDIGTGTGVLAMAAALLGAKEVVAVDNDPVAVRVARETIAANGLSGRITVEQGHLLDKIKGVYDIVVANILADAVMEAAPRVLRLLQHGGTYITGGIPEERGEEVARLLENTGFRVSQTATRDGWTSVVGLKR